MDARMFRESRLAAEAALREVHARRVERGARALVIVEGVDGAGKTSLIRSIVRALDSIAVRGVAIPAPTSRERTQWYFQRYLAQLPAAGELVLFDRSWYNRGALEPVHELCSIDEREKFYAAVPAVERLLRADGIDVVKVLLRVTRETAAQRLAARDKPSALDRRAVAAWPAMQAAYAHMVARTPPWISIDNDEPRGQLAALRALVTALEVSHGGAAGIPVSRSAAG